MPEFTQGILLNFVFIFATLLVLKYFSKPLQKLKFAWRHLARRRVLSLFLAGISPVVLHLAFYSRPEPALHDEFAYLLQADTFTNGRLANPPRPLWPHFEQFHVISQPVFASKYPPLAAVFLAIGQKFGDPYYGLLLTAALTFSAALWMFYGWFPPSYALLAWLIALVKLGPTTYWMNSYWGGLAPALGGFLVMGAWVRLRGNIMTRDSVMLGLGVVALAASRPFEGLLISAVAGGSLLWIHRTRWRWLAGASPVVLAGLALLGYYNFAITGHVFKLPYQLYNSQYLAVGNFVVQPTGAYPVYRHQEIKALFVDWLGDDLRHYQAHPWRTQIEHLGFVWNFYCGSWGLSLGLLALPFACRNKRVRWAAASLTLFLGAMALLLIVLPHYYAPAAGLMVVAMVAGLHRLRFWNPQGKPTGSLLARVAVASVLALGIKDMIHQPPEHTTGDPAFKKVRRDLISQLNSQPGRHIVLVHYTPSHNPYMDFVVNGASFASARILWARSMNPQADRELLDYFHDRQAWLLEGDADAPHLQPLPRKDGLSARRLPKRQK